jgi:hypothetical protein
MNGKPEHRNVAVHVVKKNGKGKQIQTEFSLLQCESVATQCGECEGSYQAAQEDLVWCRISKACV